MSSPRTLRIDIWSDVMCPWCLVGWGALQKGLALLDGEIEADVLPRAKKLGMGLVVWSPLAQGLLTGKYNDGVPEGSRGAESSWLENDLTDQNLERIREFCDIAQELSLSPAQLALAWCLTRPEVSSVITGASRSRQVRDNVKAAQVELEDEVRQKLDDLFSVQG